MILKGHSGCRLSITPDGNVKKVSSSTEYNSRLIKQANKQDLFKNHNSVRAPRVLSISTESELHFFEMEFIKAETFATYLINEDFSKIKSAFDKILGFVCDSMDSKDSFDVTEAIYKKAHSINMNQDSNTISFLRKIESEKLLAPRGYCHGDLTFENILINKEMFFIDFLDSFLETPLIDLAKISQEFNVYWSYRNKPNIDGVLISKIHGLNIMFLELLDSMNKDYKKTFRYLEILNLMRILPYTSDIGTYILLKKAINKLNQFL